MFPFLSAVYVWACNCLPVSESGYEIVEAHSQHRDFRHIADWKATSIFVYDKIRQETQTHFDTCAAGLYALSQRDKSWSFAALAPCGS